MNLKLKTIPNSLKELPQWLMWKLEASSSRPTKLPYQVNGQMAKSNDKSTWNTFEAVAKRAKGPGYSGIGFVFSDADPFIGIDLDGCRNPDSGKVADWAKEIANKLDSYTELSPSGTGLKVFARGEWRNQTGKKLELPAEIICDKSPAIEIYDRVRYFAVTGHHIQGPAEPQQRQSVIDDLWELFWASRQEKPSQFIQQSSVVDRARKYISMMPKAVSGQGGHNATFRVACVLVLGFALSESEAMGLLREWNQWCDPPWSDRELEHKVSDANRQDGERGQLRDAKPEQWRSIALPNYEQPSHRDVSIITLEDATKKYIAQLSAGGTGLVTLGLPDVDRAIGGGVSPGEVVILAGRPSHGKSAVAMQCVHHVTSQGRPSLVISKEMSSLLLGKRSIQFITSIPEERWLTSISQLEANLETHFEKQAQCYIIEDVQSAEDVVQQIRRAKQEYGVEVVALDYAQLIKGKGKDLREQLTNTSVMLREVTNECGIVLLLLCQISRDVEKRPSFVPKMSDLKETGQWEQDADVILFLCWPHRLDSNKHPHEYLVFVGKNRNREIVDSVVKCKFNPSRQRLDGSGVSSRRPYAPTQVTEQEPDTWGLSEEFG
jgi:KaiC/GvpD/RAD55 family RecA-like ATPase